MLHLLLLLATTTAAAASRSIDLRDWDLRPLNASVALRYPDKIQVTVPCTVIGCLLAAGVFDFDPFFGKNLQHINATDFAVPWEYTSEFEVFPTESQSTFLLTFHGINYRGNLTINGRSVWNETKFVGALRRFTIDISSFVDVGRNVVSVALWRMHDDPGQWRNQYTDLALSFDDWNPHPPDLSMGLWRPVTLQVIAATDTPATVDGFVADCRLHIVDQSPSGTQVYAAYLNFSVAASSWRPHVNHTVQLDVSSLLGEAALFLVNVSYQATSGDGPVGIARAVWSWEEFPSLIVRNPSLWWPWQFGNATPMFTAVVTVGNTSRSFKFAVREVSTQLTTGGALQFVVNRRPILITGGGFPPDMFLRVNSTRLRADFEMMRAMGLNAIRLEGMLVEDELFDLADEYGMLVLPGLGCCDGWQHWSRWPQENYVIAAESVREQVRRFARHPSVITFLESSDNLPPPNVEMMYNAVLQAEAWPNTIISSASQQFSFVSGISGVKMVGPYSWEPPSYWLDDGQGQLANGSTMNYGGAWGFLTEGGPGESPLTLNSWKRTVPEEHLWNNTTGSMDSWWSWHMGCPFGHFRNLTYYTPPLNARYGSSQSAQGYLYRAQAANYEGIRSMFESYSRNRHVNATGIIQWQVKMAWPSHLWNLYDYYFVGGGGYYGAKMALASLHAMMSYNDGSVWVIGNRYDQGTFEAICVEASVMNFSGSEMWRRETCIEGGLPADGTLELPQLTVPPADELAEALTSGSTLPSTYFVRLSWRVGEARAKSNWYWLSTKPDVIGSGWVQSSGFRTPCDQWADFTALNTQLAPNVLEWNATFEPSSGVVNRTTATVQLVNTGTTLAFFSHIRFVTQGSEFDIAPVYCDDNFITLVPGEHTSVACEISPLEGAVDASRLKAIVETYNDVVPGN
jgi:exo-1,4-beta-D-glucosaminidase